MNLLDVIGRFVEIFVELLPRFAQRPWSTHTAVCDAFLFGPHVTWSRPILYVPIMDTVEYWPRTEQPGDSGEQSVFTADGLSMTVSSAYRYMIADPVAVRRRWTYEEYELQICMAVRGSVESAHSGHNWPHIQGMEHDDLVLDARDELSEYTIDLTYFCVEERVPTRAVRHYGVILGG